MTLPIPTKSYVETRGGEFWGSFAHPLKDAEASEYWAFKTPRDHLRHEVVIRNRVVVFSLPWKFKDEVSDMYIDTPNVKISRRFAEKTGMIQEPVATSKPKYTNKQVRKRKPKKAERAS